MYRALCGGDSRTYTVCLSKRDISISRELLLSSVELEGVDIASQLLEIDIKVWNNKELIELPDVDYTITPSYMSQANQYKNISCKLSRPLCYSNKDGRYEDYTVLLSSIKHMYAINKIYTIYQQEGLGNSIIA